MRRIRLAVVVLIVFTAAPIAVAQFSKTLPVAIPSVQGWERITGDLTFASPCVDVQYEFYVNPERQAAYEVVRYRVTDRAPKRRGRRYPATEKLQWDRDGHDVRRFECVARSSAGAACAWEEMEKGGAAYLREVGVLLWLYGKHNKVRKGRRSG